MQTVTMTQRSNGTAGVLDPGERSEIFYIVRNERPDWDAHFAWLRRQPVISPTAGDRSEEADR